jgi:DnaJ-class molecular chaperone
MDSCFACGGYKRLAVTNDCTFCDGKGTVTIIEEDGWPHLVTCTACEGTGSQTALQICTTCQETTSIAS